MMEKTCNENEEKSSRQNAIGYIGGQYASNNGIACDEVGKGSRKMILIWTYMHRRVTRQKNSFGQMI